MQWLLRNQCVLLQLAPYYLSIFGDNKISRQFLKNRPLRGLTWAYWQWIICTKTTFLQNKIFHQGSHVVSLFVTCYKHIRLVWWPQAKLKLLQTPFWDYYNFLPTISMQMSYQINIRWNFNYPSCFKIIQICDTLIEC